MLFFVRVLPLLLIDLIDLSEFKKTAGILWHLATSHWPKTRLNGHLEPAGFTHWLGRSPSPAHMTCGVRQGPSVGPTLFSANMLFGLLSEPQRG